MRWLGLILLPVLASGCQFSANRYADRVIKPAELVGTWRATELAMKDLRDLGVHEHLNTDGHELILRADGTCSVRTIMNMPVFSNENVDYRAYESGCRWKVGDVGHQALKFELTPMPVVGPPYYYFAEEGGKLLLWQNATDPDAWRYMEFERSGGITSADLRLSLQDVRVFQIHANVSGVPGAVGSAFAKAAREERFAMAEPGAAWQDTDVVRQPALARRRLGTVALSESFCLIFYELGGRGHSYHVAAFDVSSTGATLVWHAILHDFITEPAALLKAIDEGKVDDDPSLYL
jgi:hypothetical protein